MQHELHSLRIDFKFINLSHIFFCFHIYIYFYHHFSFLTAKIYAYYVKNLANIFTLFNQHFTPSLNCWHICFKNENKNTFNYNRQSCLNSGFLIVKCLTYHKHGLKFEVRVTHHQSKHNTTQHNSIALFTALCSILTELANRFFF